MISEKIAGQDGLARFYLMRQVLHIFYAMVFLLIGSSGKPIQPKAKAPAFNDFHDALWAKSAW